MKEQESKRNESTLDKTARMGFWAAVAGLITNLHNLTSLGLFTMTASIGLKEAKRLFAI